MLESLDKMFISGKIQVPNQGTISPDGRLVTKEYNLIASPVRVLKTAAGVVHKRRTSAVSCQTLDKIL